MKTSHLAKQTSTELADKSGSEIISPLSLSLDARPFNVEIQQPPGNMPAYHWHGHIEINIPFDDDVEYSFNEHSTLINAGHIGIFWASIPHRLTDKHNCRTMAVFNIPVYQFLSWQLSQNLINHITHGIIIQSKNPRLVSLFEVQRWEQELKLEDPNRHKLVYDEIQLMIKRVSLDGWLLLLEPPKKNNHQLSGSKHAQNYVRTMLDYIANHYNAPLTVQSVANAVGLNTNYAMGLFQSAMQLTIKQYIIMMRINHAKALLSDTNRSVLDISLTTGFSSISRFYDNFLKYTGVSPNKYRKQIRADDNWSAQGLIPTTQAIKGASTGEKLIMTGEHFNQSEEF
ncbi:transcriptional regulator MelR [Basfia succiniciproducens]|uniref:transcriptional regulator MelR n=1 Tax=Basfia succiniciproducens TaxID=653940 RepID=UPI0008BF7F8C|nr:transcriptional regulator MelR [Basfia succiniciproducens]SEP91030.1 transcriptional regulator, AraC family [Basfia succiniciproducens]